MKLRINTPTFSYRVAGKNILKNPPQDMTTVYDSANLQTLIKAFMQDYAFLEIEIDLQKNGRALKIENPYDRDMYDRLLEILDSHGLHYLKAEWSLTKEVTFKRSL